MEEKEKEEFFRKFNASFFKGDQEFISEHVAENVSWSIVGTEPVKGKQGLLDAAFGIADFGSMDFQIDSVICSNGEAAVKGISHRTDEEGNVRNFCYVDLYRLDKDNTDKVRSIVTFVIELKEDNMLADEW
ncbi:MAG TPA: nuclear transport factor 2 family protein [Planococcus sp. (in: firmicutes)]|nr:nuclear transport factor 2 family protein [Planococcus sp. (in: firmicutes)]